jgi:hypothetical protein
MRTARSITSGENFGDFLILAPFSIEGASSKSGAVQYWCRRELAHWLAGELAGDTPTIVGIDHALSFPLRYFEVHQLAPEGRETARSGRQ